MEDQGKDVQPGNTPALDPMGREQWQISDLNYWSNQLSRLAREEDLQHKTVYGNSQRDKKVVIQKLNKMLFHV